ncbi:SUMO1 sentrin specific peptidase 1 [Coemansia sp. RSA 1646]|nr:SUMO1 sentrin specific peptidase 1 [Coemansia sp. RSA 1646]KAJ2211602.1 SUMO1 sentrin specific peptidase 1 [Coemansia sp. RSA 487]
MQSSSRKRDRSVDALDMPGEFPDRQKDTSTRESVRRNRNNSLVREYTLPSYSYRMQAEYASADDDSASVLTIDSSITMNRQPSFASSEATTQTAFAVAEKGRTKPGTDDWISQLRKKIQETLAVSAPSTARVLTPAYDKVCQEESDFDARLEKARQEMAFKLPPDAPLIIKRANSSGFTAEINNVPVNAHDIATLGDGEWLNDEVINFYMQLLITRSENQTPALPKVHAFNTFFYSTLQKGGYVRVRRWTRRIPLFEKDLVIVPVHLGVHWCCAVIDFRHKTIRYYDALHGSNQEALDLLLGYLREESRDKLGTEFDDSEWTAACDKEIPRQLNGYDCGIFAITFAEYVARDAPFAFSQKHCPFLRKKVTYEIATQSLIATLA